MIGSIEEYIKNAQLTSSENFIVERLILSINTSDCFDRNLKLTSHKLSEKIKSRAVNFSNYSRFVSNKYGIKINKLGIAISPVSQVFSAFKSNQFTELAKDLEKICNQLNVNFLAGFTANLEGGITTGEKEFIYSIPEILDKTEKINIGLSIGDPNEKHLLDELIRQISNMQNSQSRIKKLKFTKNFDEVNSFGYGSYHGNGLGECLLRGELKLGDLWNGEQLSKSKKVSAVLLRRIAEKLKIEDYTSIVLNKETLNSEINRELIDSTVSISEVLNNINSKSLSVLNIK